MPYSVLTAEVQWHTYIGAFITFYFAFFVAVEIKRGKCRMRGMQPGTFCMIVQSIFCLFCGAVSCSLLWLSITGTHECRAALREGRGERVAGVLSIESQFSKPGYGYIIFRIADRTFQTYTQGGTDCGEISGPGRAVLSLAGKPVVATVHPNGTLLALTTAVR